MALGNKMNYCSLKDAFKDPGFEVPDVKEIVTVAENFQVKPTGEMSPKLPVPAISGEVVCSACKNKKKMFLVSDILNTVMIAIILWIVVSRPKK